MTVVVKATLRVVVARVGAERGAALACGAAGRRAALCADCIGRRERAVLHSDPLRADNCPPQLTLQPRTDAPASRQLLNCHPQFLAPHSTHTPSCVPLPAGWASWSSRQTRPLRWYLPSRPSWEWPTLCQSWTWLRCPTSVPGPWRTGVRRGSGGCLGAPPAVEHWGEARAWQGRGAAPGPAKSP